MKYFAVIKKKRRLRNLFKERKPFRVEMYAEDMQWAFDNVRRKYPDHKILILV